MDIIKLLDSDGIKLKKQSYREFSAACPFCGGRDRLRVWPDDNGGTFWCRVCGKGGDMVRYHMLTTGKKYFDSCYDLGIEPRFRPRQTGEQKLKKDPLPPMKWRRNSADAVNQYHNMLLSEIGVSVRSWLAARGITERTIHKAQLGLNATDRFHDRKSWGLPEEKNETGNPKTVWLPAGLVIPTFHDGAVIRIRIRRHHAEDGNRYVTVSGSSRRPMRLGRLKRVVVVESDLDAMLISQAAGDIVSVISLGSVSLRPDAETDEYLRQAETILLSLDYDEVGRKHTHWWKDMYGDRVKRWPVPAGKDPGEAYRAGVDIRAWIQAGFK